MRRPAARHWLTAVAAAAALHGGALVAMTMAAGDAGGAGAGGSRDGYGIVLAAGIAADGGAVPLRDAGSLRAVESAGPAGVMTAAAATPTLVAAVGPAVEARVVASPEIPTESPLPPTAEPVGMETGMPPIMDSVTLRAVAEPSAPIDAADAEPSAPVPDQRPPPPPTPIRQTAALPPVAAEAVAGSDTTRDPVPSDGGSAAADTGEAAAAALPGDGASDGGDRSDGGAVGTDGALQAYAGQLVAWLERHKRYPAAAQRRGLEGTAMLRFTVDDRGVVVEHRLDRGAGHAMLDDAVRDMIARADPMPPIPPELAMDRLQLTVPIAFSLRRSGAR